MTAADRSADTLRLEADSLLSKWGFNDGDVPEDFQRWQAQKGLAPIDWVLEGDWHSILTELISTRLLPRLDRAVTVTEMSGNHNPARAADIDGMSVDDYVEACRAGRATSLHPEYVDVPFADVQRAAEGSENGLFWHSMAVSDVARELGLTPRQRIELRAIAASMDVPADDIRACGTIIATGDGIDSVSTTDLDGTDRYAVARGLAARRAAELVARPDLVPRTFDAAHWAAIHHQLFQDTDRLPAAFSPQAAVSDALAGLRNLTPGSAAATLLEVIPVLVDARPFTGSLTFHDGNRRSRRILIQHALQRVGLAIDWKWFPDGRELYEERDVLEALLELAVQPG